MLNLLQVLIYGKERFRLGTVDYSIGGGLPKEVIAGIAASGAVLVVIAIIVVLLVFKRSRYHKQRYKSMVKQVDQLESNSRQEIKAGRFYFRVTYYSCGIEHFEVSGWRSSYSYSAEFGHSSFKSV